MKPKTRAMILESPFLPILTFPYRMRLVLKHLWREFKLVFGWLFRSREFANFTYDLTPTNKLYLTSFVANVCDISVGTAAGYIEEIENNVALSEYIDAGLRAHRRGREIDGRAHFGRRVGWYALVRATRPNVVVETGTEKGLGSLVLAEALKKNGSGKLITIDMEPSSGLLIGPEYEGLVERMIGDSLECLSRIPSIDFFIHDSDHSAAHERAEFEAVASRLSPEAMVLSDNSHVTDELVQWSSRSGRRFGYFAEKPLNHWHPGAGIGIASQNK